MVEISNMVYTEYLELNCFTKWKSYLVLYFQYIVTESKVQIRSSWYVFPKTSKSRMFRHCFLAFQAKETEKGK